MDTFRQRFWSICLSQVVITEISSRRKRLVEHLCRLLTLVARGGHTFWIFQSVRRWKWQSTLDNRLTFLTNCNKTYPPALIHSIINFSFKFILTILFFFLQLIFLFQISTFAVILFSQKTWWHFLSTQTANWRFEEQKHLRWDCNWFLNLLSSAVCLSGLKTQMLFSLYRSNYTTNVL